jgi:hypothetical protein
MISIRAPNLIHLKINYLTPNWYSVNYLDQFDLTKRTTRLVQLNIIKGRMTDFNLLEQLIKSCKTSLKKLMLCVHCLYPIDGHHLEEVLKPCKQLEKLVFWFEYNNKRINIDDCQRSFQSEWWLASHLPSVYIQHNDDGGIIIASMPCQFSFTFKNNLDNWYFNKGSQNSSFVRFTNINTIHFTNDVYQPVSLEYLYSVDRIFTSSNQSLCFDFCDLKSADILFDLVSIFPYDNDLCLN